jgi:peptide/nickel transport system substrate-binding protein
MTQIFRCDYIGSSSDSQYCNPEYDKLYDEQATATSDDTRHTILAQMQNLIYDEAPYDVLFYDSNLAAYRTDKFAGWQNQPIDNGTPLFTYSTLQYTLLTDATKATETPPPAAESLAPGVTAAPTVAPTPAPSADSGTTAGGGDNTALIIGGVVVVVVVVVVGLMLARRRSGSGEEEE